MTVFPNDGSYTSSFGAQGFWVVQQGARALPRRGRVSVYQRDHVPFSNDSVIQLAGYDIPAMQYQIVIRAADYDGLLALVNTRATLTISGEGGITAILTGVSDAKEYAEGFITCTIAAEA